MRFIAALFFIVSTVSTYAQKQQIPADYTAFKQQYKNDLFEIIKSDTANISFYDYNPKMIIVAEVQLLENQPVFKMATHSGKTKDAQKYARIKFMVNRKQYQLYLYQLLSLKADSSMADELFLPFRDKTSGSTSYGGGRYLDFKIGDIQNGSLKIDFNRAYNPYCAFTTGYNCPIPPGENTLAIDVLAGESYKADKFQH